jgi:hypothetical protein
VETGDPRARSGFQLIHGAVSVLTGHVSLPLVCEVSTLPPVIEQVSAHRRVHLVGSGGTDDRQYMELAAATVGPYLVTLPNGQPRHPNWVIEFIEEFAATSPVVTALRRSRMSEPRALRPVLDPPRLIAKPGHTITKDDIPLPYATEARIALPIFQQVTHTYDLPTMRPQCCVAGPFDVGGFRWLNPLKHYPAERDAALREIRAIRELHEESRTIPVIHLELPAETYAVARLKGRARVKAADWLFRQVCEFIAMAPAGTVWIIHLCYGNKNGEALISPRDCSPLVVSTDALVRYWPEGQVLDAVHWPIGDSKTPPPARESFWFPGDDMALPASVHLSAGLARVGRPLSYLKGSLRIAEDTLGRRLGVSTSCGNGRDVAALGDTMNLLAALAVA